MFRAFFAGAAALALVTLLPGITTQVQASELSTNGTSFTQVNLARIKAALKLSPDQQIYWPPIEAAMRDIQRGQATPENAGFIRRISSRVYAVVLDSAAAARLAAAARPLVKILSDEQKQTAIGLAQEMGLGPMLAAL